MNKRPALKNALVFPIMVLEYVFLFSLEKLKAKINSALEFIYCSNNGHYLNYCAGY